MGWFLPCLFFAKGTQSCIRHKIPIESTRVVATRQRHLIYLHKMVSNTSNKIYILGVTHQGRAFRPSDWAERLAGVMSQFRPGGAGNRGSHIAYSPWCVPTSVNGVRCVVVDEALRGYDVMAWDFCVNFAKDNELQTLDVLPPNSEPVSPRGESVAS